MAVYDAEGKQLTTLYGSDGVELEIAYDVDDNLIYSKRTLTGITATYSGGTVADGTTLDQLTGITVIATYSDGTTGAVTGYTLSGDLTAGQTNTVTVTYQDKTTTFEVTVNAEVTLTGIAVNYTGGTVAAGTTLEQLTGITVAANYSDGSTATVAAGEYTLSGTLTAGQDNTLTVTYQGKTATFMVTVEADEPVETGFRFYVPGLDNAPAEISIDNTVANQGAAAWYQAFDDIATQSNANGNYTVTCSLDDENAPHMKATDGVTDMRFYVFTPKSGTYDKTYILHAGTHSSEKNAIISCWRICQILCTIDLTKAINPTLKYVCQNVRFIVNPLVNPAMGLSNGNPNVGTAGVNCNRNYDGWWSRVNGGAGYETGEYPMSEPEMRFVRDTIQYIGEDNIHSGLDMHNGADSSEDYWVGYNYDIPKMEENVRKLVAKCIYDDINGSTTVYLPDNFVDDSGNKVVDMVGKNMTIGGATYKTPHCMDTMTAGNLTNFGFRALNIPLHTCEVLKYKTLGLSAGDASVLSKSVKIYMNIILMDCITDYDRIVDAMDEEKPFRLAWCGGIQEKYFTTAAEANIINVKPNCVYSFTSIQGVYNGFKYLAKDRTHDFESALATGEIAEMGGTASNTESLVPYEKLLTPSTLQIESQYGTRGYFTLIPESGSYTKTIVLYGGQSTRYNTRPTETDSTIYKFLKILRDYSGVHSKLAEIRNNCRIVVIPCLATGDTSYPEDMGSATGNAAQACLCDMLSDIGTVDLFVQIWAINTANLGYKYNKTDSDGNALERLCMADTGSSYGVRLAQMVTDMNANETSAVRYEITGAIWGADETVKNNSLLHYLKKNGYVTDAVRIMPTIDLAAKAYANERFNVSGGAESTTAAISVADFQKLNSETARRVSMLVNVIGCAL